MLVNVLPFIAVSIATVWTTVKSCAFIVVTLVVETSLSKRTVKVLPFSRTNSWPISTIGFPFVLTVVKATVGGAVRKVETAVVGTRVVVKVAEISRARGTPTTVYPAAFVAVVTDSVSRKAVVEAPVESVSTDAR